MYKAAMKCIIQYHITCVSYVYHMMYPHRHARKKMYHIPQNGKCVVPRHGSTFFQNNPRIQVQ